jgi:hypothetical protein
MSSEEELDEKIVAFCERLHVFKEFRQMRLSERLKLYQIVNKIKRIVEENGKLEESIHKRDIKAQSIAFLLREHYRVDIRYCKCDECDMALLIVRKKRTK